MVSMATTGTVVVMLTLLRYVTPRSTSSGSDTTSNSPNIILIMADDLGYGDVTPSHPSTPNLQRLFTSGTYFTDYHSAAPVCTPSRAGLLTGRLPQRNGVISNFEPNSRAGLPLTEITLGEYMRGVGYRTGIIGKWHLGHTPKYNPRSRGFDYWYGLPYSNDMGCTFTTPAYQKQFSPSCPNRFNLGIPVFENFDIVEQPANLSTLSARYEKHATAFMESARQANKKFFLYFPMTLVHTPLAPAEQFRNTSGQGHFGDTLRELDHTVGVVLDYVEAKDLRNSTLIIFTSDNGPWEVECELAGDAGPFKGTWQRTEGGGGSASKMTTWEGGHRVPFIASWPGTIKPGLTDGTLISAYDIVPSLAVLAGFNLPPDRKFDGRPLPFVSGYTPSPERAIFIPEDDEEELVVARWGKHKVYYKTTTVVDCSGSSGTGSHYHNPALVFDVSQDPSEGQPISSSSDFLRQVEALFKDKRSDIKKDFRSHADYSLDKSLRPCCNKNHPYCACNNNPVREGNAVDDKNVDAVQRTNNVSQAELYWFF